MIRTLVGLRSRITSTKPLLTMLALLMVCLFGVNEKAWGKEWKWELTVNVSEGKGSVYAKIDKQVAIWYDEKTSDDATSGSPQTITVTTNNRHDWQNSNRRGRVLFRSNDTGYTFAGWYDGDGNQLSTATDYTAFGACNDGKIMTVYAHFRAHTYTIKFNGNGGSGSMGEHTCTYDKAWNLTANAFTRTGYTFAGWNTKANGTGTSYTDKKSVKNLTSTDGATINLYAQWTANTYKVRFNGNGNSGGSMSDQTMTCHQAANLTANTFTRSYTVTYNADGGNYTKSSETATYTFDGWAESATGAKKYNNQASVTNLSYTKDSIVNLYAKWTGGTITLDKATKDGKVFEGWYLGNTDEYVGSKNTNYNPTGNVTLKAHWVDKAEPKYTWNGDTIYHVGDAALDLNALWVSNNDEVAKTFTLVSFTPSGTNNTGAPTTTSLTGSTLSLGQAGEVKIKVTQPASTSFYAGIAELTLTINKHENIILVKGKQSYRKEIDINSSDNEFTFAATNTDYEHYPIQVEQIAGHNIATYNPDKHVVHSANVSGEAIWQVTQAENYYYESASSLFAIDVRLAAEEVCYLVNDDELQEWSTIWASKTYEFDRRGKVCTFKAWRDDIAGFSNNDHFYAEYSADGSNWISALKLNLPNENDWDDFSMNLPADARYVRFATYTGATGRRGVRNVKVSRFTYLNLSDETLTFAKTNTNAPLYCGDELSKTFTVDWSMPTNGTEINISSNNPKFTVSPAKISNTGCDDGQTTITVTYSSDTVGTFDGKIIINNEVYYKEIAVSGTTIRRPQTITWSTEDETFVEGDEISASAVGAVTMSVSGDGAAYVEVSGNKATINELDGELSSVTAILTASAAQTDVYNAKDSVRTITITNKTKQSITWEQDFAHYKTTDTELEVTLNATASSGLKVYYVLSEEVDGLTLSHNADSTVWTLTHSNKECGGVTLIAKQDGNSEYAAASSVSLPVRVLDPTKKCPMEETLIVSSNPTKGLKSSSSALLYEVSIPDRINIAAKRSNGLIYRTENGLKVDVLDKDQKKIGDGFHYGADIINTSMSRTIDLTDEDTYKDVKYIRITSESSNGYDVTSLSVHRRRYCRIAENKTSLSFTATTNSASNEQAIDVQYANYPLMVECSNSKFTFTPTDMFGDCGSYGVQTVLVTYHAGATAGDDSGELYIKDNTGDTLQTITLSATINKSSQTITSHNVASSYKTTDEVTLTVATSSGLSNFEYTISDDKVAQVNGSKLTFLKEGHFDLTIREPGNAGIDAVEETISNIEVKKVTPTITGPAIAIVTLPAMLENVPVGAYTAEDDKGTEVTGTFTWNGTPLKMVEGTRYHSITFTPDQPEGKDWYDSKTFDLSVTAVKGAQTIDWSSFPDESSQACSKATSFSATASSGLTVVYTTSDSEIATIINNNELHVLKAGEVTIYADQEGDDDYAAAPRVSKTITLTTETPVIATMPKADTIYVSQKLAISQFHDWSATVNEEAIEGSFAWNNPNILPEEGKRTYKATFTGSPAAWYETVEVDVEIVCRRYPQEVTWDYEGGTIYVNDVISFSGAESSVEQPIHYLTSDLSIAEVDEAHGNKLIVHGKGTIEVIARPEENAIYEATEQRRTLTILPLATTVTANPAAAEDLTYGQALNATDVVGGTVKGSDDAELQGTWSWNNGAEELNAGQGQVRGVTFTPNDSHWYATATSTATVNVNKATPEEMANNVAVTYGTTASSVTLSGSGNGTWSWNDSRANETLDADHYSLDVRFTPNDGDNYNVQNTTVQVTVNPATPDLAWTKAPTECLTTDANVVFAAASEASTGAISYEIVSGTGVSIHPTSGVLTITEAGTVTIQATIAATRNYESRSITTSLTITPPNVFTNATGNGKWDDPANWSVKVPQEEVPDVVVSGELVIDGEVTVGDLTIQPTGGVTIVDDGKLTVTGHSNDIPEYGDIHVMDDGALELESAAVLEVRHFTLDAKLGDNTEANPAASGQVEGKEKLNVNGDVYFQMTFDPSGNITYGWYDFVVPFEVEVLNGVYDEHLNKLTYGVDYLVMNYNEQKRAVKGKDWNEYKGTMQPGCIYTITFEETKTWNTFIFKKKAGSNTWSDGSFAAEYSSVGQTADRGWNGLGNGTLQHRELSGLAEGTLVQMYNHTLNCYEPFEAEEKAYAVGTAFFLQVDGNVSSIDLSATDGTKELRAPKRDAETTDKFRLVLAAENSQYTDRLWFSADEEATETYVIGHDVLKMGTLTSAKKAQMWSTKGGKNLCDVEATLNGSTATTPLSIFAPAAGNYELTVEKAPENTMLYLTYNGRAIWNLTYSPYVFDLTKGTTEGYGLKMYVMQVATDVETVSGERLEVSGNRKVLIDDVIYIVTPEGKMYDITGKSANY